MKEMSRSAKYESKEYGSRSEKNQFLYNEVNQSDDFYYNENDKLYNNSRIIDFNELEELAKNPKLSREKQQSRNYNTYFNGLEDNFNKINTHLENEGPTSHNINDLIKKAKSQKEEVNEDTIYRNTQYDILKKLNINNDKNERKTSEEEMLQNLINNVTKQDASIPIKPTKNNSSNSDLFFRESFTSRDEQEAIISLKELNTTRPKKQSTTNPFDTNSFNSLEFTSPIPIEELNSIEDAVRLNNRLIKLLFSLLLLITIIVVGYFFYTYLI